MKSLSSNFDATLHAVGIRAVLTVLLLFIVLSTGGLTQGQVNAQESEETKPRVVVTTDAELDDQQSMVRFLLYSNEFDVEAIIPSSSMFHWEGHNWAGLDWYNELVDHYAEVYDNLLLHDADYPTPDYLKSIWVVGNIYYMGEMDKETDGSNRIVEILLDDDPAPVWLQAWGGTNTIARALKTIQEQHPEEMERVTEKARLYVILDQDNTLTDYILPNWPNLQVIISATQFWSFAYFWESLTPNDPAVREYFSAEWHRENILDEHGDLFANYTWQEVPEGYDFELNSFLSEGDSPSFIYQIPTGLRSSEDPTYGGWGGRFERAYNSTYGSFVSVWTDARDDGDIYKPIWRWVAAMQNDFAARADWTNMSYEEANHSPVVTLNTPTDVAAQPGDEISISASASDPDGDDLTYSWWRYDDADTYSGAIDLTSDGLEASFVFPNDVRVPSERFADGDTIHIILEVTDNGTPPLTSYQRVVVTTAEPEETGE